MTDESRAFEDNVRELLRLAGYVVSPETLIDYKKVDIYAEERRFGVIRRIAVECKNYSKALTQEEVSAILANYRGLYESSRIDELLLVTRTGITPSAVALVRSNRFASHMTLTELQAQLIDFSSYLGSLSRNIDEDELPTYYVRPRADDEDLQDYVEGWIKDSSRPLAILGGYGMGKTTFVRYFSAKLATAAAANASVRIPLVVRLPEISSEQSLEGLLGRVLASSALVRNYNFDVFMALNAQGRFVVFLDGFDEMKHTLTWEQFKYNFGQLNRLVMPNSRVMLLGRPTAFMSDDEHSYALHGDRVVAGAVVKDPEWPDYEERHLQPFSSRQVEHFVREYSAYLNRSKDMKVVIDPSVTLQRLGSAPPSDLVGRPVQLRILAEVLPQWPEDVTALTLGRLYSTFVDIVIDREQKKLARLSFDTAQRRAFARRLAYWLWTSSRSQRAIQANEIPASLFPAPRPGETSEGVRRDLVSACFLERKLGDSLYFPHRSFQEFLVAEYLLGTLGKSMDQPGKPTDVIERMAAAVTPEVATFIASSAKTLECKRFDTQLSTYRGRLGRALLLAWTHDQEHLSSVWQLARAGKHSSWQAIILTLAALRGRKSLKVSDVADSFIGSLNALRSSTDRLSQMLCIMALASKVERLEQGEGGRRVWRMCKYLYALLTGPRTSAALSLEREFLQQSSVAIVARHRGGVGCTWQIGGALSTLAVHLRTHSIVQEWLTELTADELPGAGDFAGLFHFNDSTLKLQRSDVLSSYEVLRRIVRQESDEDSD